jgi:hypothetical protein
LHDGTARKFARRKSPGDFRVFFCALDGEGEKEWGGRVREGGEKLLGPDLVFPALLHCI